jgi:hypothetical protein
MKAKTVTGTTVIVIVMAMLTNQNSADEPESKRPVRKPIKLPGLVIDFPNKCLDLEATVCLDRGFLELIACTKGSKEHESIVAIKARPMHVHTALLLLGANNGNPAMRKPVSEEKTRWVELAPRGDSINVFLVVKNSKNESVERSISDFVKRAKDQLDDEIRKPNDAILKDAPGRTDKFPNTFLFAGSQLRDNGKAPRRYLADQTGHVISIATFGDELLCLPSVHSQANGALMWRVDSTHLPKVGSKVTLRLRRKPKAKKSPKAERTNDGIN